MKGMKSTKGEADLSLAEHAKNAERVDRPQATSHKPFTMKDMKLMKGIPRRVAHRGR